jgi:hypothetical protein
MKRTLLALACALAGTVLSAQNPVIRDQYTADPTARVFDGKVWLYASHDIISPVEPERRWFCMADYHCFSSEDLVHWTDHGVILDQKDVPWGNPEGYSMWAPDCVERGGKYYFYFPNAPREGRGFAVGVAVADRPDGPFTPQEKSIQGVFGIDPCCLLASDGNAYLYWSGMGFSGAKLKENMTELDGTPVRLDTPLPAGGLKEGPFVFEREGKFYLTYPWVQDRTESLVYAMADSPLGPFEYKGKIMEKSLSECWTNHHSFVEYHGQWYLFYHHNDYSPDFDKNRSVRIDKVRFNPDGTIEQVTPTYRGVGVTPASDRIQMDRYSGIYHVAAGIDFLDPARPFDGWFVRLGRPGTWVRYDEIDFGETSPEAVTFRYRAPENAEVSAPLSDEESLGTFLLPASEDWTEVTLPVTGTATGLRNLKLLVLRGSADIDWVSFGPASAPSRDVYADSSTHLEKYLVPAAGPSAVPDEEGFLRRWLLLEPISKPNRSNTVFTDSYLREVFSTPYFPGQLGSVLPKDGSRVKVKVEYQPPVDLSGGRPKFPQEPVVYEKKVKKLQWHAFDSRRYNVKLFRFATNLTEDRYGVIFWVATVVNCEEDIPDVRLSVGSNSASMWWVNGQEALLLSGDRRMVADDAASEPLTLRKGRNVIWGAVINGPGMSDFCARFIDKAGNPVRGITLTTE